MLKEYVAKRLAFLQPQGKHAQHRGKREQPAPGGAGEAASGSEESALPAGLLEAEAAEGTADMDIRQDGQEGVEEAAAAAAPVLTQEELEEALGTAPALGQEVEEAAAPVLEQGGPEEAAAPALEQEEPEGPDVQAGVRAYEDGRYEEAWPALAGAAKQGDRDAQFLCGQMLRRGLAEGGGDKPALSWYKRAAKQGHPGAQMACGAMYEAGRGADMDLKRALFWYEQAAKQGAVEAQLKCGCMYFRGRAETRNPKKARRWLEAAAGNGSEEAKQILRERF